MSSFVLGDKTHSTAAITVKAKVIVSATNEFVELTEYPADEIIGQQLEVFLNSLIRELELDLSSINFKKGCYIFTRSLKALKVYFKKYQAGPEETVLEVIKEPNATLDESFPYLGRVGCNSIAGIAFISASDMVLLQANRRYLGLLEPPFCEKEFSIGKKVDKLVKRCKCKTSEETWRSLVATGEIYHAKEVEFLKDDGSAAYWDFSIVPISEKGKVKYLIEILNEVTETVVNRKKAEEQSAIIKAQKEQLEAVVQSMSDGLEIVDSELRATFLNQAALDFFYNHDAKANEGASLGCNKYYYGIDGKEIPAHDLPAARIYNQGSFENYILTIERPDKKIYTSINGSPIYDSDGGFKSAILCLRDITEQVEKEKSLQYNQRLALEAEQEKSEALEKAMELKDEFLYLITHEFKTPIAVINSALQAMEFLCRDFYNERSEKFLNIIKQNTNRQLRLVNNLLDITRINAGQLKGNKIHFDITFVTNSIVDSVQVFARQKNISLCFATKLKETVIYADVEKYERIMLNLISNALKFTSDNKTIKVSLSSKSVKKRKMISVSIEDEGIGIPKEKQEHIFERFGQVDSSLSRQAEGTGIGLHLVKLLVNDLGGEILLESEVGKGSCFTVLLPAGNEVQENDIVLDSVKNSRASYNNDRIIQAAEIEFSDIYF